MARPFRLIRQILTVISGLLLLILFLGVLCLIPFLLPTGILIVIGLFFGLSPQETLSHPLYGIGFALIFPFFGIGWLLTHRSRTRTALQPPRRGLRLFLSSEADLLWGGVVLTIFMGATLVFPDLLTWVNNNFWLYFVCIVFWPLPRKIVLSAAYGFRKPSYQGS